MAFSVKVDLSKFKKIKEIIERPATKRDANLIGKKAVELIRGSALAGKSPITGKNFPAYRGSYRDQIRKGRIPGKGLRPVNLQVTGDFLADLKHKPVASGRSFKVNIGYETDRSANIEAGLRDGKHGRSDKKPRPTLPTRDGEQFSKKIQDALIELLVIALNKRLRRVR